MCYIDMSAFCLITALCTALQGFTAPTQAGRHVPTTQAAALPLLNGTLTSSARLASPSALRQRRKARLLRFIRESLSMLVCLLT
eukprot:COSAG06_NODE_3223_length_5656_cov_23.309340_6_plen_84_part_00